MSAAEAQPAVRDNPVVGRYELEVEGQLAIADYVLHPGGVIEFPHTLVPPALRGRSLATRLVEAGLARARAEGLRVRPSCSMFARYMERHPETQDLLE